MFLKTCPQGRCRLITKSPRILAHRGASGHACENSLEAFREAIRRGADGVELDIHATRDGGLVVHHDPVLPGLGPIASLSLAAAAEARLPNGETVPALAAALGVLPAAEVWIEVKALPARWDDVLLSTIAASPAPDRCAVHSFDHRIIARLRKASPPLRLGVLSASYPLNPAAMMLAAGATALWQEASLIDEALVTATHRAGGEVIAWTVNDATVARALAVMGVDALCGNFPERLRLG